MSTHEQTGSLQWPRRDFLQCLAAGVPLLAGCSTAQKPGLAKKMRPNILFILADDLRYDTIHALGNPQIITPNLDALCKKGLSFTQAHIMGGSQPAVCVPSRAMLLTGRNLFSLKDTGNQIPTEHTTMPEAFRAAGYQTCGIGKWHNGRESYARSFTDGAQIYFGGMADHFHLATHDFDPSGKYSDASKKIRAGHSSELLSSAAVDFLHNHSGGTPFFLYLAYLAPHDPRTAPEHFKELYNPNHIELPENFLPEHPFDNGELQIRDELLAPFPRTPQIIREHIADYFAMITHMDEQIGRIMIALKESGHDENTIVVFSGDNGLALGQHGLMGKQNLYECSIHVPLLMIGSRIPKNINSNALCYLQDVFPTLCNLTDIPVPGSVKSHSLSPALEDPNATIHDHLFYGYKDAQRSVSDGHWKLIAYAVSGKKTTQLFDLKSDPLEMNNLAGDRRYQEHVRRLRNLLEEDKIRLHDTQGV